MNNLRISKASLEQGEGVEGQGAEETFGNHEAPEGAETTAPTGLRREYITMAPPSLKPKTVLELAKKHLEQDGPREGETMQALANDLTTHMGGAIRAVDRMHTELDELLEKLEESNKDRDMEAFLEGFNNALAVVRRHHGELSEDLMRLVSGH